MSAEKEKFKTMDLVELAIERKKFQDKIDGPENDGRVTANGSADLDYWMEMVEDLTNEIYKRLVYGRVIMEALNFDSYLQDTINNIGSYLNNPQHRRSGKTYNMCRAILAATVNCSGRILVCGINLKHLEHLKSTLLCVFDATNTEYNVISKDKIGVNNCIIVFDAASNAHKYAGVHPNSRRFIDHFVEEHFVLDGLQKLKNDLAVLKEGDGSVPDNTKNHPQYVLFDPVAVGWDVGLDKAIENAQKMHVPLAVESQEHLKRIRKRYPYVCVGILER